MGFITALKRGEGQSFFRDASMVVFSNGVVQLLNLLFWVYMVRNLDSVNYGVFNSLISLSLIVGIPALTIRTVIVKFISQYIGANEESKVSSLFFNLGKRFLIAAVLVFLLFLAARQFLGSFLNISSSLALILTGGIISLYFLTPLFYGALQGLQRFSSYILSVVSGAVAKLLSGIILVMLGFKAIGALIGYLLANIVGIVVGAHCLPKYVFTERKRQNALLDKGQIYQYFIPVAAGLLCFSILTNIDVVMVKHYFSPEEAGIYSIAQIVGRILLFLPLGITIVMFPKLSYNFSSRKETLPILKKSALLLGIVSFPFVLICILKPVFVLKVLTAKFYPESIALVRLFSTVMASFSFVYLILFYYLSIHNLRFIFFLLASTVLQVFLIIMFHATLTGVLCIMLVVSLFLLLVGILDLIYKRG